jgi:lipocalin
MTNKLKSEMKAQVVSLLCEGNSSSAQMYNDQQVRYCTVCNRYHFFGEWNEIPAVPHFFGEQAKFTGTICDDCRWHAKAEAMNLTLCEGNSSSAQMNNDEQVRYCTVCNRYHVFGEWSEIPSVPHFFGEQAKFTGSICDDCRWHAKAEAVNLTLCEGNSSSAQMNNDEQVRYCTVCNRYHVFGEWSEIPSVPHFFGEQAKFTGTICDDCR